MSTKKVNMFGFKFLTPIKDVAYQPETTIPANTMINGAELTTDVNFTLENGPTGWDNQWLFIVKQGATAYSVTLPTIKWPGDIAPSFSVNTATELRLCYRNGVLTGVWNPC